MKSFEDELDMMRAAHLDECAVAACAVCEAIWRAARQDAAESWLLDHEAACDGCVICVGVDDAHAVLAVD